MALNNISYNGKTYTDQDIEKATGFRKSVVVGDELPYDTFEAEVWDYANALLMMADSGPSFAVMSADGRFMMTRLSATEMTDFAYGTPVTWTYRGKVVLKQFLESVKRTGKYKFLLSCVSGIGLIAKSRHYGGLYSNVPFSVVLADIIGGAFPYTVDSDVASIAVYGWLPVNDRRGNLRKLLTAYGILIKANSDGSVRFSSPDITAPAQLADQDIFMGGSVDHPTPYQAVKITEHSFAETPNDILTTLLDGEAVGADIISPKGAAVKGSLVTFNDPMHDLSVTGSTILESGVNYAILSPSAYCTLTGYKYSHTTRIVAAGSLTATEQATKRLDDCTLVNIFNSDAVAQRWLEYYSAQKVIQVAAVWNGEQTGNAAIMSDPYEEQAVGIVEKQDVRLSAKLVVDTTVQVGKIPTISGNLYTNVLVVTQSGPVTVPSGSKGKVLLVLISGGQGGSSGYAGDVNGGKIESEQFGDDVIHREKRYIPPSPAAGGKPGSPGLGARILRATLENVVAGETVLNVTIGPGGKGGLFADGENAPGQNGGETIVNGFTTADGQVSATGYYDQINGILYGAPGGEGSPGGAGAGYDKNIEGGLIEAESITAFGQVFTGGTSVGYSGRASISEDGTSGKEYGYKEGIAYGSYGGGPAYGANGENGALTGARTYAGYFGTTARGAVGGIGATALPPPIPANRGTGGYGGNGGGGAGACGGARIKNNYRVGSASPAPDFEVYENTMTAGNGSDGGDGADGVLLIYY